MRIALVLLLAALPLACCGLAFRSGLVRDAVRGLVGDVITGRAGLATIYLLYGAIAMACLATLTPPYQVPDENTHFLRADDVELGGFVGTRVNGRSGAFVDAGIPATAGVVYDVPFHVEVKVDAAMRERAAASTWNEGKVFWEFPNTAVYPPYFYTVSALAIAVGKAMGLGVTATLTLARLLNGLVGVGLGAVAIALSAGSAPWLFALLMLPMTLAQMASVSQDSLLLPMAAIAAGLFVRLIDDPRRDAAAMALLTLLLALVATGRFPYAALALLPLLLDRFRWPARLTAAVAVVAATLAWMWTASTFTLVPFGPPEADATAQARFVLSHPDSAAASLFTTLTTYRSVLFETFIGRLGWLDAPLPGWYVATAVPVLVIAAAGSIRIGPFGLRACVIGALTLVAVFLSVVALLLAFYLTWSAVGAPSVSGVQGRYFIPLAFFLAGILAVGTRQLPALGLAFCRAATAVFPLLTIPVVILSLVARYH